MEKEKTIFAFDVGKSSLGICARRGDDILTLRVLTIPVEFASIKDFRTRRRAFRTRLAHKKREKWLQSKWLEAGLTPLTSEDDRIKREFPKRGDETVYNSALLRIALLQEKPLEEWQIFKALWSAIQHRGYDNNCDWSAREEEPENSDEKENQESVEKYIQDLYYHVNSQEAYLYPCYLEASLMGLWSYERPNEFCYRIDHNAEKVRMKGRVAPRHLVEKEVRQLFENAKRKLPVLQKIDTDEFLYGPGKRAYASLHKRFSKYRGTEWDAQGVLSQKVPRFDNRIINKCQMLPKRNVCKAKDPLNIKFTLLMRLKNLRFTDADGVYNRGLTPEELVKAYEKAQEILSGKQAAEITYGKTVKTLEHATGMKVNLLNMKDKEKIRINTSGRSRFCRPALKLMTDILMSGVNPKEFDISPYIESENPERGITRAELESMVSRLGDTWESFHIGDKRDIDLETALSSSREAAITKLIGSVNNPIVRHRLTIFWNELRSLEQQLGVPDRVILEFVRGGEGLEGQTTAREWENLIKENEKKNDELRNKLEEAGLPVTKNNLLRMKLYVEQAGICPYTGEKLSDSQLNNYDIDHIVPVSNEIATDSLYNKVLCLREANREKGNQTPYEWLSDTDKWLGFLERVTGKNSMLGKRKQQLLTSPNARELVESYNGLAETAYVARLAQQIVALNFGWGLQTRDDERRVFVNDGKVTAKIRQIYGLNELLLSEEERSKLAAAKDTRQQREVWQKNRKNDKHHAVDAYCISYSQDLTIKNIDEWGKVHWYVPGLENSKPQFERKLLELFPSNIRRNIKELYPLETIYGYRKRKENGKEIHYLTVRKNLVELLGKERKKIRDIFDLDIQADLALKSEEIKDNKEWLDFLKKYSHPKRQSKVNSVLIVESRSEEPPSVDKKGRFVFGEYKDFGNLDSKQGRKGITKKQFKHSKANKGQLLYCSGNTWKVQQVLVHEKTQAIKQALIDQGFTLYRDGALFYPGCTVFVPKPFKAGSKTAVAGLYKSRTIRSDGYIKLETPNGEELLTNIKYLVEAGFELVEYNHKTVNVFSSMPAE